MENSSRNTNSSKPTVIALVGPTCSGKTALSLEIAASLSGEVIACDSRTVYRHLDIGTAKPSSPEQARIQHHMLDVVDPDSVYTVAEFCRAARQAIDHIHSRNKIPIVCGGTGFYSRALLEGLDMPEVPPQTELRISLQEFADQKGNQALHESLHAIDPVSAARINVNDRFRIIRAIEVSKFCNRPFSQVATRVDPPYNTIWIALTANDRQKLYAAIKERFKKQIEDGLLQEVQAILQRWGPTQTISNTVNYREFVAYLQGKLNRSQAEQECIKHNCNLARRQLIWFRANPKIKWFAFDEINPHSLAGQVFDHLQIEINRP